MDSQNYQQKYQKLLVQFNQYREKIVLEKEKQLQQFQKYKAHLDKFYKQTQKKYQNKLQEERINYQKKLKKLQTAYKQKQQDLHSIIQSKNKFIQQLKRRLTQNQHQKHQIIQNNTRMLYQLSQGIQNSQQILGPNKSSYQELARLYQFVLEQNNNLKKELFKNQIKNRQLTSGQEQNRQTGNKIPTVPKDNKDDKKKKKTTNSSFQNSKFNNESFRPKSNQVSGKKQSRKT